MTARCLIPAIGFKVVCFMSALPFASLALADNAQPPKPPIEIVMLNDYQNEQQLFMDAQVHFELPKTVLDAIHHEIPLTFTTQIELIEQQRVIGIGFNRTRIDILYHTQLQYFGYNRRYVIANMRNQQVQSFDSLNDALNTLGTLSNFQLADLADLHPDTLYRIRMKVALNKWHLPTPLIIHSMFDSDWQLDSDWRSIKIQSPKSWL